MSIDSPSRAEASPSQKATDRYGLLREFMTGRVLALQGAYLRGGSGSAAPLAALRRALGTEPGADPVTWQYTLGLPAPLVGRGDDASPAERAVHYSMALFALHQQSQSVGMHRAGQSMGHAARQLGGAIGREDAVRRRFTALGTASSLAEAATHARGLITQFRSSKIPLDYGLLAVDFLKLQDPRSADGVRLSWGRDYYRAPSADAGGTSDDPGEPTPESSKDHEEGEIS